MTKFDITLYQSLTQPAKNSLWTGDMTQLVELLTNHRRLDRKEDAPMFGPYVLRAGGRRRDQDVQQVTLAVFDVDEGTPEDYRRCKDILHKAGVAQIWYSSHSYHPPAHAAFRLVLPLAKAVRPAEWHMTWRILRDQFKIPCAANKSTAASHAYFLPSCPPNREPFAEYIPGEILTPPQAPPQAAPLPLVQAEHVADESVDVAIVRDVVARHVKKLLARKDFGDKQLGFWLTQALEGMAFAEHGDRHNAALKVTGTLAKLCPTAPIDVLLRLLTPSVQAMRDAGSKLTLDRVEGMLTRALTYRAELAATAQMFKEIAERMQRGGL